MQTLSFQDTLMIRATAMGRVVADFNATGFSNLTDVMHEVCRRVSDARGMIELSLRNSTRGWTTRRALYI